MTLYNVFVETSPQTSFSTASKEKVLRRLLISTDIHTNITTTKILTSLQELEENEITDLRIVDMREANKEELEKWYKFIQDEYDYSEEELKAGTFSVELYDDVMNRETSKNEYKSYTNLQVPNQNNESSVESENTYSRYTNTENQNKDEGISEVKLPNGSLFSKKKEDKDNDIVKTLADIFKEYLLHVKSISMESEEKNYTRYTEAEIKDSEKPPEEKYERYVPKAEDDDIPF